MGKKLATDGTRYKVLGNSMSMPVMEFAGYRRYARPLTQSRKGWRHEHEHHESRGQTGRVR